MTPTRKNFSLRGSAHGRALLLAAAAIALLPACSHKSRYGPPITGGPGAPAVPSIDVLKPAGPVQASRGGQLEVLYVAEGSAVSTRVDLLLDADGDLATQHDQIVLVAPAEVPDGVLQQAWIDLAGIADGEYTLYARAVDAAAGTSSAYGLPLSLANRSWAVSAGGKSKDHAMDVATYPDGSTLVVGYYKGEAHFGEPGIDEVILPGADHEDIYLARYAADGSLAWAVKAGGDGKDQAISVAALADGGAMVSGTYEKHAVFGEIELPKSDKKDFFVARYDASGEVVWVTAAGGHKKDEALAMATLSDERVVIAGTYESYATFGEIELPEAIKKDVFVACLAPDGTWDWAISAGGEKKEEIHGIAVLPDDRIAVTGYFEKELTLGAGEPNETTLLAMNSDDVFLACYSPEGALDWAVSASGEGKQSGMDIAALANGTLLLVGDMEKTAVFGAGGLNETLLSVSGGKDAFCACYDANGQLLWAECTGGPGKDQATEVLALENGSAVLVGTFRDTIVFDAGGLHETTLVEDGRHDGFLLCLDASGEMVWVERTAGKDEKTGPEALGAYADCSVILAGRYKENVTFGAGGEHETTLEGEDHEEIYLARYNADGSF